MSASIFEELSAATPSWAGLRLPGEEREVREQGDQEEEEEEEDPFTVWSSGRSTVEACQVLPPSLILNVVSCEF